MTRIIIPEAKDHMDPTRRTDRGFMKRRGVRAFQASQLAIQLLEQEFSELTEDEKVALNDIRIGGPKARNGLARVKAIVIRINHKRLSSEQTNPAACRTE